MTDKNIRNTIKNHAKQEQWAIVAYICLLPIFRRGDKTEMVIRL
jgi:hypothetical protein